MKKLFLITAMLLASYTLVSAQFMNDGHPSHSSSFSSSPSSFGTISASYNIMKLNESIDSESAKKTINGLSMAWTNANILSSNTPIYIDYGLGVQYSFKDENKVKINFLSAKVPLSLLYRFEIPNSKIAIAPYAGLDAVVYILGKSKGNGIEIDLFKDQGGEKLNRFNLDWHIGARFLISKLYLGVGYEGPIVGFYNKDGYKLNSSQVNISLGIAF